MRSNDEQAEIEQEKADVKLDAMQAIKQKYAEFTLQLLAIASEAQLEFSAIEINSTFWAIDQFLDDLCFDEWHENAPMGSITNPIAVPSFLTVPMPAAMRLPACAPVDINLTTPSPDEMMQRVSKQMDKIFKGVR